jgi:hypothetical protein
MEFNDWELGGRDLNTARKACTSSQMASCRQTGLEMSQFSIEAYRSSGFVMAVVVAVGRSFVCVALIARSLAKRICRRCRSFRNKRGNIYKKQTAMRHPTNNDIKDKTLYKRLSNASSPLLLSPITSFTFDPRKNRVASSAVVSVVLWVLIPMPFVFRTGSDPFFYWQGKQPNCVLKDVSVFLIEKRKDEKEFDATVFSLPSIENNDSQYRERNFLGGSEGGGCQVRSADVHDVMSAHFPLPIGLVLPRSGTR